jgi:hypothetical protein
MGFSPPLWTQYRTQPASFYVHKKVDAKLDLWPRILGFTVLVNRGQVFQPKADDFSKLEIDRRLLLGLRAPLSPVPQKTKGPIVTFPRSTTCQRRTGVEIVRVVTSFLLPPAV